MTRDTRLTLWPEQTGYLPLLSSWSDKKNLSELDLSACLRVDSCGLAGSVLKVHHAISQEEARLLKERSGQCLLPLAELDSLKIRALHKNTNVELMDHCIKLNFVENIRDRLSNSIQREYESKNHTDPVKIDSHGECKLSFPVIRINFTDSPNDRRAPLESFIYKLEGYFDLIPSCYQIHKTQLITTLYEIAKNSADHTNGDAFLGCDLHYTNKSARLNIVIGDIGPGIYENLRPHIERILPQRKGKLGLSEVYKWALEDGNSSKIDSGKNMGFGMSLINSHCKALNADLSVFDVKSRGLLTSIVPITNNEETAAHNAVWRCFQRTDGVKPFFYHIELEV
jgi:hypothetical protein